VRKTAFILVSVAAFAGNAIAQNSDSIKTQTSQEVVVTGQYEPQSVDKSVYKVRVIPMEVIRARGAVQVQDVLRTELNIRFQQDLALGTANMSIMGLGGQNIKLLIDGMPQIGRQSTDNSFNINQVNVNSIDRIEIIEGPMSVVYGADALAGVINIITKKAADGRLDLNARVHEETVGSEYGLDKGIHNESIGAAYSKKKFISRFDFGRNDFDGFQGAAVGRDKQWHPKNQWLGDALVGYNSDRTRVYYRLDYLFEDLYNPENFVGGSALEQNYISTRLMHQIQSTHKFNDRLSFAGALAYSNYSRRTRTTTVSEATGDVRLATGAGQQDVTTFDGITFRGTFQYRINDKLMLQPGLDLNNETGKGGRLSQGSHQIGDYAFFVSGEWTIGSRVQLRPGLRMTYNTIYNAPPVLPSLNAKIGINDKQDIRLSYGRGFRAPSLRELYFDFVDASHQLFGNPNLKAELSNSFNASWNWQYLQRGGTKLSTVIGGFYNDISNQIDNARSGNVASYINKSRFTTEGINWNNTLRNRNWNVTIGASYTGLYNNLSEDNDEYSKFEWYPEVMTNISCKTTKGGWLFSAYYKYTGRTPFAETKDDGTLGIAKYNTYSWADVSAQKEIFRNFTATLGVKNLFNVKSIGSTSLVSTGSTGHGGGGSQSIGAGTSYFLDLIYTFNQ
jgi:outer membrane receptor for ferrienterochelin and colicins